MPCKNCGQPNDNGRDVCSACLAKTPACIICGRAIDDHSLTYSKEKYPKPICPPKGKAIPRSEA